MALTRAPEESSADWLDEAGNSDDAVGNFPARFFDAQWPQLAFQIERHLSQAGFVPVDVSAFSPEQVARIELLIAERGLGPRVFLWGRQ